MSGGSNRRFPRTARALAEPSPTIEREKIRHRRPNDLLFDGPEPSPNPRAPLIDDLDDGDYAGDAYSEHDTSYDDESADWTEDDGDARAVSAWDDESEGDWVLHGEDDAPSRSDLFDDEASREDEYVEIYDEYIEEDEDSGVVWEDEPISDQRSFEQSDEIAFDQQQGNFGFAPEVELAGRRDVRPKPPRPAPSPRAAAARRPPRPQRGAGELRGRPRGGALLPQDPPDEAEPRGRRSPTEPRQHSEETVVSPVAAPVDSERFSRTRATLGMAAGASPPAAMIRCCSSQGGEREHPADAGRRRKHHPRRICRSATVMGRSPPLGDGPGE